MALNPCYECKREISSEAKRCLGCGAANRFNKTNIIKKAVIKTVKKKARDGHDSAVVLVSLMILGMLGLFVWMMISISQM